MKQTTTPAASASRQSVDALRACARLAYVHKQPQLGTAIDHATDYAAAEIAALREALARLVNHYDALQSSNGATVMRWSEDFTPSHWIGRMSGDIEKARAL